MSNNQLNPPMMFPDMVEVGGKPYAAHFKLISEKDGEYYGVFLFFEDETGEVAQSIQFRRSDVGPDLGLQRTMYSTKQWEKSFTCKEGDIFILHPKFWKERDTLIARWKFTQGRIVRL